MPTAWLCCGILILLTLASAYFVRAGGKSPLWIVIVYLVVFVVGFLTWAAAGASIPVPSLLAGSLALAVPLIYGALCGVIGERAGVVNIAIEGQLLAGAFTAAVVATITGQPFLGLLAAMVAGMLVAAVLVGVRAQVPRRPGDRRRGPQRPRDGPHELPLLAGARPQRRDPEHARRASSGSRSRS